MPKDYEHREKYEHNRKFANDCQVFSIGDEYDDWYITVMFYCAVHLTEAVLAKTGMHCDHSAREEAIRQNTKVFQPDFLPTYKELYSLSIKARYGSVVKMNKKDKQIASDDLRDLEASILHQYA